MPTKALVWLRRDLRLSDHTALELATRTHDQVYLAFVYDTNILNELTNKQDRRVQFIQESIQEIADRTQALITLYGDPTTLIPQLATDLQVDTVIAAHDDDPYAIKRDQFVKSRLKANFQTVLDHLIKEKQEVMKDDGAPYRVFTPYSKTWRKTVHAADIAPRTPDLSKLTQPESLKVGKLGNHTLEEMGFNNAGPLYFTPGETAARVQLQEFIPKINSYAQNRNDPSKKGTSGLSVHLRFGTISVRECFRQAQSHVNATKWETELIWREFYHMLLANFPELGQGKTFQPQYNELAWPGNPDHFEAWKSGQTGYPLIDAAMRCFAATGWMHNRLRMVVAMFLTKDLLLDWRLGEKYFAENLLDFELASNNGGWQWSASTGADAQPYFRIFNPYLQSVKFDPEGTFIREWVPEVAHLDNKFIHWPFNQDGSQTLETPTDYPSPIVFHQTQKQIAVSLFKS
ncbi:MAG: cryptochrome/photolyase family protein [Fimbriimonadaceae bacterium]